MTITAKEFIQRNNRSRSIAEQRALIEQYTGSYNVNQPHGVQLDNTLRRARVELQEPDKSISERVMYNVEKQNSGIVGDLLRRGKDLQARIENAVKLDYSENVITGMKRELREIKNSLAHFKR